MSHHWLNLPENWYEYEGFVYCIKNKQTNQKYIGRKYFFSKKGTKIVRESDWKTYTSSSKKVNQLIQELGKEQFDFIILSVHRTRQATNYAEVEHQMASKVLTAVLDTGEEEYYNDNILSRYFRPKDFGTPEHLEKCKNISTSLKAAYKSGKIIHPLLGKVHPNKGKKLPQTANKLKGKKLSPKQKENMKGPITKRETKVINKGCLWCGNSFSVTYQNKRKSYCSKACQNDAHSERMTQKHNERIV